MDRLQHEHRGDRGRAAGAGACGARSTRRRSREAVAAVEERRGAQQAAATLGYSERQAQRWWARYTHGGLAALVDVGHPGGRRERITPDAWADLSAQMRAGAIGRLKDAQAYLRERWGIAYGLDGVSKLFIRRKTKLKTGRRRHAEAAAPAAFKQGGRRHA